MPDGFTYYEDREPLYQKYIQMLKLVFTRHELSFGTLMTIDNFIDCQKSGGFISYDGSGYYLDFDGNRLGSINWHDFNDYPEGTKFVAWYNK